MIFMVILGLAFALAMLTIFPPLIAVTVGPLLALILAYLAERTYSRPGDRQPRWD